MIWPKDRLTRFEVARLVGARSLQIALGAPVLVKTEENFNPIEMSKLEFKSGIIPITIKRKLPNGQEYVVDMKKGIENWLNDHSGAI